MRYSNATEPRVKAAGGIFLQNPDDRAPEVLLLQLDGQTANEVSPCAVPLILVIEVNRVNLSLVASGLTTRRSSTGEAEDAGIILDEQRDQVAVSAGAKIGHRTPRERCFA